MFQETVHLFDVLDDTCQPNSAAVIPSGVATRVLPSCISLGAETAADSSLDSPLTAPRGGVLVTSGAKRCSQRCTLVRTARSPLYGIERSLIKSNGTVGRESFRRIRHSL